MIHTARLLAMDDPSVSGFGDYREAWDYVRHFKADVDRLGDEDRKARQRYLEHVHAQVEGREQPAQKPRSVLPQAA